MNTHLPLIVVNKNTPMAEQTFSRLGKVIALPSAAITPSAVRDADILVVRSETKVDAGLLEGSAVRFVGTVTIGTDHIDLEYLSSRRIVFASAPGCNSRSVAEYIAAALLTWSGRSGRPLKGSTIGIVGAGNVGSRAARVSRTLGMDVLLNDPPLQRTTGDRGFLPLEDLMETDIISLHVPLTMTGPDATHHFFDAGRIRRMKPGAVLINTARGAVVDGRALNDALVSRHFSAAILDVWEGEPAIDAELAGRAMLATPHIAGYSLDGKLNAVRMVYEAACRYLGVSSDWRDAPFVAPKVTEPIVVPESLRGGQEILRYCVRAAYDIELDDRQLRQISGMDESGRGRHFSSLRAGYRVRREFPCRVVKLCPHQTPVAGTLRELGFVTMERAQD